MTLPLPQNWLQQAATTISLFPKSKPNKPSCMHLPWMLEKKGELEKNRGGRSLGRRKSLNLSLKLAVAITATHTPLKKRKSNQTSLHANPLKCRVSRELGKKERKSKTWKKRELRGSAGDKQQNRKRRKPRLREEPYHQNLL